MAETNITNHDMLLNDAKNILKEAEALLWQTALTHEQTEAINRICGFANRQIVNLAVTNVATCGNITIDFEHQTCSVNDKLVPLTATELKLVIPLVEADGKIVTYDHIKGTSYQSLRSHAKNARRKLTEAGANRTLKSRHKIGYFLAPNNKV